VALVSGQVLMPTTDVSLYYDELHRWTAKDKNFQTFSGLENDTIHRFLIDSRTGRFSPDTIYQFIDPHMPPPGMSRGLDAGCGYGGTCFRAQRIHGGCWTGVTVSREQWAYANALVKARGLDGKVGFHFLSYDAPLPGRFNIIVAIESLIHATDPAFTLNNLASTLDAGGRLILVDDMPIDHIDEADVAVLTAFKRAWRCPCAPSAEAWKAHAQLAGLRLIAMEDLSHLLKPRSEPELDAALDDLTAQRVAKIEQDFARLSDAEIGGLHLERLQRRGAVRYALLVFEKIG
jgi:SAM-dependent methyltransferase